MKLLIKAIFICICVSFCAVLLMEWVHQGDLLSVVVWITHVPLSFFYLLIGVTLLSGSFILFKQRGWWFITGFLSLQLVFFSYANRVKLQLRGDPIVPYDLKMMNEAGNMLSFFSSQERGSIVYLLMGVVTLLLFVVLIIRYVKKEKWNVIHFVGSLSCLCGLYIWSQFLPSFQTQQAGVLVSFLSKVGQPIEEPAHYQGVEFSTLLANWQSDELEPKRKPHIIMIMSEAFWDPTKLDVQFNRDPLTNFHQLAEENTSGLLQVPVFGGSTANTEFEVLTGFSQSLLPKGAIAYKEFIDRPIPALPHLLKKTGYETTAFHTYHHWFYNRDQAYRWLGFDRFVSLEFFPQPVQDMMYYRDNEIVDELLEKVKKSTSPQFIYAITMQNHGPYRSDAKKYYASTSVEGSLTNAGKNMLEFYADNLVEVDKGLQRLISELKSMGEDAVVVFFGDHLPLLGEDYQVYKEAGYEPEQMDQRMYQTPIVIWDTKANSKESLHMNSFFLGAYLLNKLQIKGFYYTDFLNDLRADGHSVLFANKDNNDLSEEEERLMLLQYDLLFGKQKGMALAGLQLPSNKQFRLGLGELRVKEVDSIQYKGEKVFRLKGEHFTSGSQVYIDSQPVPFQFHSKNEIIAFANKGKKIELKIFDHEDRLMISSEPFYLSGL